MEVKLSEILEAMEFTNSDNAAFLNVKTCEVILLSDEDISEGQKDADIESYPDWQRENTLVARQIYQQDSEDFIALPTASEIDEYQMMQNFIDSLDDDNIAEDLSASIKGSGAFRRFKDSIYRLGVEQQWFQYKDNEYRELAIRWCNENNLTYVD